MTPSRAWWFAIGPIAALAGLGAGQLVATLIDPAFGPVPVVASAAIDIPPAPVKEWAVQTFGTSSKTVVLLVVVAAVLALSIAAGALARRSAGQGAALALGVGLVGALAALSRPNGSLAAAFPALLAGAVAAGALVLLARGLHAWGEGAVEGRRRFLLLGGVLAGAGLVGWGGASALLRQPATTALPPIPQPTPTGAFQAPVPGMPPFITPNAEFYRIDTAFVVPSIDASEWRLSIDGMVSSPMTITYDELMAMPMIDTDVTLTCVSNEIGGPYIGNARWRGVPLMPLLERAGISPRAEQVLSTSMDGFTASTPLSALRDGRVSLLAVEMNGEPLPADHGYPVRMVTAGLYGFVSATKWVASLSLATYAEQAAYWTQRGWATDAPILTASKIQVPAPFSEIRGGRTAIAGTAWAQDRGISAVEVRVDEGPWRQCRLAGVPNDDTWRQWWIDWDAEPGWHTLSVRATDGDGVTQTPLEADPFPAGASGWHAIRVLVREA